MYTQLSYSFLAANYVFYFVMRLVLQLNNYDSGDDNKNRVTSDRSKKSCW